MEQVTANLIIAATMRRKKKKTSITTIVCGNTLGKHSLIGAGSVICKDVEPYSIMVGNPGKNIGSIDEKGKRTIYDKNLCFVDEEK